MPPMPPPPGIAGAGVSFFGLSPTIASVVMRRPATEAASCSAVRTTLAETSPTAWAGLLDRLHHPRLIQISGSLRGTSLAEHSSGGRGRIEGLSGFFAPGGSAH